MTKKIIYFFTILITICQGETKAQFTNSNVHTFDKDSAAAVFFELTHIKPVYADYICSPKETIIAFNILSDNNYGDNSYSFFENGSFNVSKMVKFGNVWKVDKTICIFKESCVYFHIRENFQKITTGGNDYIYLLYSFSNHGNADPYEYLRYSLINIQTLEIYNIKYDGIPIWKEDESDISYVEGEFKDFGHLNKQPEILKIFNDLIAKSKFVYRPTQSDLDLNSVENYGKKWMYDNPELKRYFQFNNCELPDTKINFTYYSANLTKDMGTLESKIENKKYIVYNFWRSYVLGYDKIKKKYFPIWLYSSSHFGDKEVKFINNDKILIDIYANDCPIVIDLLNKRVQIVD